MSNPHTCDTCRFFKSTLLEHRYLNVSTGDTITGHGFCRIRAPLGDGRGVGRFPIVSERDWCDEHKPVEPLRAPNAPAADDEGYPPPCTSPDGVHDWPTDIEEHERCLCTWCGADGDA